MTVPSCATLRQLCIFCNTSQTFPSCCTSTSVKNATTNAQKCASYCNAGCNTSCNTAQTYCKLGYEKITSIIPDYPIAHVCGPSNETSGANFNCEQWDRIDQKWTADKWNSIITNLNKAETTAKKAGITATKAEEGGAITATKYNQIVDKINQFNKSLSKVETGNLITATRANALRNGYNSATFSTSLCDICNAGSQHYSASCACNCNCSCSCSCPCGCSCPCDCSCSDPCDRPCNRPSRR